MKIVIQTPKDDILNLKRFFPLLLVTGILIAILAISSKSTLTSNQISTNDESTASAVAAQSKDTATQNEEMRGVWVSYIELSMENEEDKSRQSFIDKFTQIAVCCKENGFNTLIVQVRPFCDALYKSKYFPWSHILTGNQGENPDYDPLEIICQICRENDLSIHAWVNPYRISTNSTPAKLSEDNPYIKDKSLAITTESGTYLDPSNESARELIINGIAEIVENYDIDAIEFDDYFYPPDIEDEDSEQYESYVDNAGSENAMSLDNWRKANVNMLICEVYRKIHSISDKIEFGISPQGNIDNNDKIYADVKTWCTVSGFADYVCPQLYFSLDNPALSFENALNSWSNLEFADGVKLYIGLAGYKAGTDSDENTWQSDDEILKKEYELVSANEKASGFMLYSYDSLLSETGSTEIANLTSDLN